MSGSTVRARYRSVSRPSIVSGPTSSVIRPSLTSFWSVGRANTGTVSGPIVEPVTAPSSQAPPR